MGQTGVSEWQPIETMPRDGTTVLVAYGRSLRGQKIVTLGRWWGGKAWQRESGRAEYQMPTHWMPLPGPPA